MVKKAKQHLTRFLSCPFFSPACYNLASSFTNQVSSQSYAEMRISSIATAVLPMATTAINVVQSNDDGWSEINIRSLFDSLTNAGFNSIISAPADNKSGTGSSDAEPTIVGPSGCEFDSCEPGSPAYGSNGSHINVSNQLHLEYTPKC